MKQQSFASLTYEGMKKRTKREKSCRKWGGWYREGGWKGWLNHITRRLGKAARRGA